MTLAAIAATAVILRGGTLAKIVESFHARSNYRDTVKLMQGQLLQMLIDRPDVRVILVDRDEKESLAANSEDS